MNLQNQYSILTSYVSINYWWKVINQVLHISIIFHFMLLYTFTPLHFRRKYCTFLLQYIYLAVWVATHQIKILNRKSMWLYYNYNALKIKPVVPNLFDVWPLLKKYAWLLEVALKRYFPSKLLTLLTVRGKIEVKLSNNLWPKKALGFFQHLRVRGIIILKC